ncbi:MAG TPA: alpha-glucan family phosphorylase, partial [Chloroflexota bacterium]|nr:alpha-glucan family phosphorylase [Chloroflexota bacterium]
MLTLDQSTATATCDLPELIFNLRWAWDPDTTRLFERVAPEAWAKSNHNPVALLTEPQLDQTIETLSRDPSLRMEVELQRDRLRRYLERPLERAPRVGYFSAEFGITECLPIYSGGLGVLAGDHLKGASDLGLSLIGVGLLYHQGYFRQFVGWDGRQSEEYPTLDPDSLPLEPVRNATGDLLKFSIAFPMRPVWIQVWKAQVGRVPLYLLDTNVPENDPADRQITARLYGGDNDMRMRQEIVLGRGGVQALELLGEAVDVYHMNEGHAGFLALERARLAMHAQGCSFAEACRQVRDQLVFTTHTPVPAGIDYFDPKALEVYFDQYCRELGIGIDEILALGRENPKDTSSWFSMAVLGLRLASRSNGVSKLHQKVSTKLWAGLYADPGTHLEPIRAITNAVHTGTWLAPEMSALLDRHLDPEWRCHPERSDYWTAVRNIAPEELWNVRTLLRHRLIDEVRKRTNRPDLLDPDVLTIGFARRFATYKRAALILRDLDRLARILTNEQRPVQIIYAGKAHPRDEGGKDLIQQL